MLTIYKAAKSKALNHDFRQNKRRPQDGPESFLAKTEVSKSFIFWSYNF
jgi:hypothetical protein